MSGYPERGDPDHNQIQVCVRREVAYIPDTGSDGNIVSAVEFARHYGHFGLQVRMVGSSVRTDHSWRWK